MSSGLTKINVKEENYTISTQQQLEPELPILLGSDGESELNGKKSIIAVTMDHSDNDVEIESEELVIGKPIMTRSGR